MKNLLVFSFLIIATSIVAQNNFEGGIFLGFANYQGDLSEDHIEFGETKLSYGIFARFHNNRKFKAKANIFLGTVSGSDLNATGSLKSRGWSFKSNIIEAGMQMEYHPFGKSRFSNTGIFKKQLSPYVATGLALSFASEDLTIPDAEKNKFPEVGDKDSFIAIPLIAGLRMDIIEDFSIGFELGWRTIFSDYLDGVAKNGNDKKYDWYNFIGATFSYHFGNQSGQGQIDNTFSK